MYGRGTEVLPVMRGKGGGGMRYEIYPVYDPTADNLKRIVQCVRSNGFEIRELEEERTDEPTELVRCKDCEYYLSGDNGYCDRFLIIGWDAGGYCAWGKRRES